MIGPMAVGRFLAAEAAHEGRIAASGKNPTIVGPQQE